MPRDAIVSSLRRDAHVYDLLADGFEEKSLDLYVHAGKLPLRHAAKLLERTAETLREAVAEMSTAADDLEADDAS